MNPCSSWLIKMIHVLTIEFVPFFEIERLDSASRIDKLLKIVKQNKIVLLEGRLKKTEESDLIAKTMSLIDEDFRGIELAVVDHPESKDALPMLDKLRKDIVNMILGDRQGFTIIGPANIVKEIKKDPHKIQLLTEEAGESIRSGKPIKHRIKKRR